MRTARTQTKKQQEQITCVREGTYAFVDVETTGTSAQYGQIIEIGILRIEHGVLVETFSSLVRPARTLPPIITSITGITDADLESAPTFEEISGAVERLLSGATFVAHNAPFDYSFIKSEFRRLGIRFNAKTLCTVKVSRALSPQEPRHNLDAVIDRYGLPMENRHRAFDDAEALVAFLRTAENTHGVETVEKAITRALGHAALPETLDPSLVAALPHTPGVYIFYGPEDEVLYVGKSVDIKARVMSHFTENRRSGSERALIEAVAYIEHRETTGELSALLLEAMLIKELMPLHNRKLRKAKKLAVVHSHIDEQGYAQARITYQDEIHEKDFSRTEGVFRTLSQGKASLKQAVAEYGLCPRLLGIENGSGACFSSQLGKCKGACAGIEDPKAYNERFAKAFKTRRIRSWPFKGPVLLPEDPEAEEGTAYVIDQWRIIKTFAYTQDGYSEEPIASEFDYDSYKILARHLLRRDIRAHLRPYTAEVLGARVSTEY